MYVTILWLAASLAAPPPAPVRVGTPVASVTLKDIHRRSHSLADFRRQPALMVVFIGTECPLANQYLPTLTELHDKYLGAGGCFAVA